MSSCFQPIFQRKVVWLVMVYLKLRWVKLNNVECFNCNHKSHLLFSRKDCWLVMVQSTIWWVKWFFVIVKCQSFDIWCFSFIFKTIWWVNINELSTLFENFSYMYLFLVDSLLFLQKMLFFHQISIYLFFSYIFLFIILPGFL